MVVGKLPPLFNILMCQKTINIFLIFCCLGAEFSLCSLVLQRDWRYWIFPVNRSCLVGVRSGCYVRIRNVNPPTNFMESDVNQMFNDTSFINNKRNPDDNTYLG